MRLDFLIPIAFLVIFTSLWLGISLLMSLIGGWSAVAKLYAGRERADARGSR